MQFQKRPIRTDAYLMLVPFAEAPTAANWAVGLDSGGQTEVGWLQRSGSTNYCSPKLVQWLKEKVGHQLVPYIGGDVCRRSVDVPHGTLDQLGS